MFLFFFLNIESHIICLLSFGLHLFFFQHLFFFFGGKVATCNRNFSIGEHWDNIICFWCYQNHFYPLSTSFSFKCAKSYEPLLVTNDFWFSRYPRHLVGMLAESMLVDFHLRQMNRYPLSFSQCLILTLIYFPMLQVVATLFSQVMTAVGGNTAGPVDAVVNVYVNHEKFAFVEMRSFEEASNTMSLDGMIFEV